MVSRCGAGRTASRAAEEDAHPSLVARGCALVRLDGYRWDASRTGALLTGPTGFAPYPGAGIGRASLDSSGTLRAASYTHVTKTAWFAKQERAFTAWLNDLLLPGGGGSGEELGLAERRLRARVRGQMWSLLNSDPVLRSVSQAPTLCHWPRVGSMGIGALAHHQQQPWPRARVPLPAPGPCSRSSGWRPRWTRAGCRSTRTGT